jgi:hypothetical protein
MLEVKTKFNAMHQMVNDIMAMRNKISAIVNDLDDPNHEGLKEEAQKLVDRMQAWDEEMVQRKSKAYDDVENFPNKFTANYLFAINHAESGIPKVNQPTRDRIAELDALWENLRKEGDDILKNAVPALNQKLWQAGIGALWMGKK